MLCHEARLTVRHDHHMMTRQIDRPAVAGREIQSALCSDKLFNRHRRMRGDRQCHQQRERTSQPHRAIDDSPSASSSQTN
jgi:hypothetical protein